MNLNDTGWRDVDWFHVTEDRDQRSALMDMAMHLQILCDPGEGPVVGTYGCGNGPSGSIKNRKLVD